MMKALAIITFIMSTLTLSTIGDWLPGSDSLYRVVAFLVMVLAVLSWSVWYLVGLL